MTDEKHHLALLEDICIIFLDENIRSAVRDLFIKEGFKNVDSVSNMKLKGISDGKILNLLKEKKMILITCDYKFAKMANKFGCFAVFIDRGEHNDFIGNRTIVNRTKCYLNKNLKAIKEYYQKI